VEEVINLDLKLLASLASLTSVLFPSYLKWISLPTQIALFTKMMHEQLDLRTESANLHRFMQNFEATGKAWGLGAVVRFPKPIVAKRECLIEELVSSSSIPIDKMYLSEGKRLTC
jgi:aarF domain-containing kinase